MKIVATILAYLAASAVAAASAGETGFLRQLQGDPVVALCLACTTCENVGELCDLNTIVGAACANCESFNLQGLCDSCDLCAGAGELCDPQQVFDISCDIGCDGGGGVPPENNLCFSAVATVQVEGKGPVAMKDLQVGEKVLTASNDFEPVYAFGHRHLTHTAKFIQFNGGLEITGAHLVFIEGKVNPVRADSVKVGDFLQGGEVKSIKTIQRSGLYTPLTPSGTVVVNGITASSYISLKDNGKEYVEVQGGFAIMSYQDFIHMALSPYRMFTMGVSSRMGNTYTEDGIPLFASAGMDLAKWADSQNILVQVFLLVGFLFLTGASMVMENTFGPSMAPLAMFAGATAYGMMTKFNISIRANKVKSV